jgi:hypothetical protein
MKLVARFGLIALLPAAFNPVAVSANAVQMLTCTGDGKFRTLTIPLPSRTPPGEDHSSCCVKGCHSAGSRKRGSCHI